MCTCVCTVHVTLLLHLPSTDMEPLAGVVLMDNSDMTHPDTWQRVMEVLRSHQADVVMRWVVTCACVPVITPHDQTMNKSMQ